MQLVHRVLALHRDQNMRYLLDTDWVIQSLAGRKEATLLQKFAPSGICLSIITVGELYEVAFNSTNPQAHLSAVR